MSSPENIANSQNFMLYSNADGQVSVAVLIDGDTLWTSQRNMANIFGVDIRTINEHIQNIYNTHELSREATIRKNRIVQTEGTREVQREIDFYSLDVIISVGYRVNSIQATQFRIWATKTLDGYLKKGFVLDDERLKQGKTLFGKDYFNELIERIREIRASERRFYQKVTDLYALSIDYDANSLLTQKFYATVQNKLEFAITHQTAAEIIKSRASHKKPNMGLMSWKNMGVKGKVLKSDVTIAKNYLREDEIRELNKVVTMYLDYAELQAERQRTMRMSDWIEKLNAFLKFNEYDILRDSGKIRKEVADSFAENEYIKFRPIQDAAFQSDFDKVVKEVTSGRIPSEAKSENQELTTFNKSLKKALNFNPKEKKSD